MEIAQRALEITALMAAPPDGAPPESASLLVAARIGEDHRQGDLALAKIVARVLAKPGRRAAVVEQVVDELEGHAQPVAEGPQRPDLLARSAGDQAAHLGGRREEGGGLAADDLFVARGVGREIARGGELENLALGDHGGGVGKHAQHRERSGLDHELERTGEEIVAHQHARLVVPEDVRGGAPAPLGALVDDVVVEERRGVDEFHRGGELDMVLARIAVEPRPGEGEHRPQALAAGLDEMGGDRRDARRVLGRHAFVEKCGDPREVIREHRLEALERALHILGDNGWRGHGPLLAAECTGASTAAGPWPK